MADAQYTQLKKEIVAFWECGLPYADGLWGFIGSDERPIPKQLSFLSKRARLDFLAICDCGAPAEVFGRVIADASKEKDAMARKGGERSDAVGGFSLGGVTAR